MKAPAQLEDEVRSPAQFDAKAQQWDAEYEQATVRGHWWRTRLQAAAELIGDGPGSLLEVGVGSGRLLEVLAGRNWTVSGMDPAAGMLELARARVPPAAERLTVGRAEALPFPAASFDVVVAIGVLEYTDLDRSLEEIGRVLRPGGRAVIGLRNGHSPTAAWHRTVTLPVARALKRVVPFGRPLPRRRRPPMSAGRTRAVLATAGLSVERLENVACAVLPDPLDRLGGTFAYRAARCAERSSRMRRVLGTQRVVVAKRPRFT